MVKKLIVVLVVLWLGGLAWFSTLIPKVPAQNKGHTDAIVVLTGGGKRLGKGFTLLKQGVADELLISGVGEGVRLADLLAAQDVDELDKVIDARAISLDHASISTATNATTASEWIANKGFKSIRLVTANYHMPRSLLEFSSQMPADVTIYPEPVFPNDFKIDSWYMHPGSLKLMTSELAKYIFVLTKTPPKGD